MGTAAAASTTFRHLGEGWFAFSVRGASVVVFSAYREIPACLSPVSSDLLPPFGPFGCTRYAEKWGLGRRGGIRRGLRRQFDAMNALHPICRGRD